MIQREIAETRIIRRQLRRAWPPFFARHGRLLPVQLAAIPRIMDGANLVIASPTASGKTEAVVAPTAELILNVRRAGLKLLYISPTRALVNDLAVRLVEPLEDMGLSTHIRTGDRRQFNPSRPSDVLLTTPESVDSLLCRYPSTFDNLQTVILDELHLTDGMYRGDQTRLLFNRIRDRAGADIRCHALSATLSDPIGMASRYFDDPELVEVQGQREIEYGIVGSIGEAIQFARQQGMRKLIMFANSRAKVEQITVEAKQSYPARYVVAHHGSLSRRLREDAEEFMRTTRNGICAATMTLEIGIDIGDIDGVVLADVPHSVSALLQRIGRGNRRSNKVRAIAVCQTREESEIMASMFEAARAGNIEASFYRPDLSVVVQQLFSMLFGRPSGMSGDELWQIVDGFCDEGEFNAILSHLAQQGNLHNAYGKWSASTEVMDMGERGRIHSNIPGQAVRKVFDSASGREVGVVGDVVDHVFALAGSGWEIVGARGDGVIAQRAEGNAPPAAFHPSYQRGAFTRYLPVNLQ